VAKLETSEKTGDEPPGASLEPRLGEVVKIVPTKFEDPPQMA